MTMDVDTQEMLRASLRPVLAQASNRGTGPRLAEQLAELGWDDVLADDPTVAVRILFETRGEVLASADALGPLLSSSLADSSGMAVARDAVVVLPASLRPDAPTSTVGDDSMAVDGVALSEPPAGAVVAIPVADGRVAVGSGDLRAEPVDGIDPSSGLVAVTGWLPADGITWIDADAWRATVAIGRWALASELACIGARAVSAAVAYTKERHQYGRPIGSFQALQHRLASAHASVVGAVDVAIEAAASGSEWDALVAKCLAGRAAENACTQAQQAYGAIGFTWEHDLHRSLRRTYVLDRLLGGWRELEVEIGATIQRTGAVPKIGRL
jgi:hypothetical protein